MSKAKFLVTGGAGFIGSHLVDFLYRYKEDVIVLDNLSSNVDYSSPPNVEIVEGDIRNTDLVRSVLRRVDGCFHLAAIASVQESIQNPFETSSVNVCGTLNIFREAARFNIPVVYASSASVYGAAGDQCNLLEESVLPQPISPYAVDKLSNEMYASSLGGIVFLKSTGLRFFNIYGPRQRGDSPYSGVISKFVNNVRANESISIFGDGMQVRDFVHVSDVVRFLYGAISIASVAGPVLNVATGSGTTIKDLAELIKGDTSIDVRFVSAQKGDVRRSVGSPDAALAALNLVTKVDLKDGLGTLYQT